MPLTGRPLTRRLSPGQAGAPGCDQRGPGGSAREYAPRRRESEQESERPGTERRSSSSKSCEKSIIRERIAVTSAGPTVAPRMRSVRLELRSTSTPRTHGSALFTRGQTQVAPTSPLSAPLKEEMRLDTLGCENDQATSTTTTSRPSRSARPDMRGPKRRDIGHGALAERALEAVIPERGVSLHHPRCLRDAGVQRLLLDGDRSVAHRWL